MLAVFTILAAGGGMFFAADRIGGMLMPAGAEYLLGAFVLLFIIPPLIACIFMPPWASETAFSLGFFTLLGVCYIILLALRKKTLPYIAAATVASILGAGYVLAARPIMAYMYGADFMWYESVRDPGRRQEIFKEFGVTGNYKRVEEVPNKAELANVLVNTNLTYGLIIGSIVGVIMIPLLLHARKG